MSEKTVVAYKAFNDDWTCRGFKFEVGKTYEHTGKVKLCSGGFHACLLPFDCYNYYQDRKTRARVTLTNVPDEKKNDTKIVGAKITIEASLTLPDWIKAQAQALVALVKGGNKAKATTGNCAHSATTGYCAHSATTGDCAHSATTGNSAHSATTGNSAHSATTGNSAHSATTGYCAHSATTGNCAHSAVKGRNAIAAALGYEGKAKGEVGSWLVCAAHDSNGKLVKVGTVKVDGKKIRADTFYRLTLKGSFVKARD